MKKRPADNGAPTTATARKPLSSVPDTPDDTACTLCLRRPRVIWHDWCQDCLTALCTGLRRRRAAELRLPPLDRAGAS
jgi:hypothetical protein